MEENFPLIQNRSTAVGPEGVASIHKFLSIRRCQPLPVAMVQSPVSSFTEIAEPPQLHTVMLVVSLSTCPPPSTIVLPCIEYTSSAARPNSLFQPETKKQ